MQTKNLKLFIASGIVLSPFLFLWQASGAEGIMIFLSVVGAFVGLFLLIVLAQWALETVLLSVGFSKQTLHKERTRHPYIIFYQ